VRREEEEAPPCIMSRDATSTAGAMAPLLVAALNPSNNTAIWSHDNDEEWSEREREDEQRTRLMDIDELVVVVVLLFAAHSPSIPVQGAAASKLGLKQ
jgi:hypothetical protein